MPVISRLQDVHTTDQLIITTPTPGENVIHNCVTGNKKLNHAYKTETEKDWVKFA